MTKTGLTIEVKQYYFLVFLNFCAFAIKDRIFILSDNQNNFNPVWSFVFGSLRFVWDLEFVI